MVSIIQEYLKKINSYVHERFSWLDVLSISSVLLIFAIGTISLGMRDLYGRKPLVYTENVERNLVSDGENKASAASIVASKNGKTYFFSWCTGVERIKETNKITFGSEEEAKTSGRTLSKTCK